MSKNGQVVLITGASSGMGKETAKELIKEGYTVYAAARRVEKMEDLKALGGIPPSTAELSDRHAFPPPCQSLWQVLVRSSLAVYPDLLSSRASGQASKNIWPLPKYRGRREGRYAPVDGMLQDLPPAARLPSHGHPRHRK